MKKTLDFYKAIYDPLFKKNYTSGTHRGGVSIVKFERYREKYNKKIDSMIDIGCAWGKTLKYWTKKKVRCVGVDVSKVAVSHCKKQGYTSYLASATNLSMFKDNQFDLYMASDVYEHLRTKDLEYAIDEAKRITKKYLLIRPHPALDKRGRVDKKKALHLTVWDLDKWQQFFEDNGLNVIKIGENEEISYKNVFLMSVSDKE